MGFANLLADGVSMGFGEYVSALTLHCVRPTVHVCTAVFALSSPCLPANRQAILHRSFDHTSTAFMMATPAAFVPLGIALAGRDLRGLIQP